MDAKLISLLTNCKVFSTVNQSEDEEAWLAARTNGIGGSDVGAICGVSPFTSARQVYLNKTGQYPDSMKPGDAAKERMYFGHVLEPIVAEVSNPRNVRLIYNIWAA
jgi:predicted phage-related endonuclease